MAIRSHYDVLGVANSATTREIKEAYRKKARRVHPDRVAPEKEKWASLEMATLNQAWSVLSNPESRRSYDASLRASDSLGHSRTAANNNGAQGVSDDSIERDRVSQVFAQRPLNTTPARFPWRSMLTVAGVASVLVVIVSIISDPGSEPVPDQLLQSGSCVVIEPDRTVREVSCKDPHDGVVRQLIGFDMRCPQLTEPYRDRQGMGTACVVPVVDSATG